MGESKDAASMNIWLHKQVMYIAKNLSAPVKPTFALCIVSLMTRTLQPGDCVKPTDVVPTCYPSRATGQALFLQS